jgi:hypothetical protein
LNSTATSSKVTRSKTIANTLAYPQTPPTWTARGPRMADPGMENQGTRGVCSFQGGSKQSSVWLLGLALSVHLLCTQPIPQHCYTGTSFPTQTVSSWNLILSISRAEHRLGTLKK